VILPVDREFVISKNPLRHFLMNNSQNKFIV
jgi:hypothetical protein